MKGSSTVRRLIIGILVVAASGAVGIGLLAVPVSSWRTGESAPIDFHLEPANQSSPDRLWIDTDPACGFSRLSDPDDCFAIAKIAMRNTVDLAGISTVFGNADLATNNKIANELVSILNSEGYQLPEIFTGADSPFDPESTKPTAASIALSLALSERKLTVLALGPLTNIAQAIQTDPSIQQNLTRIIAVMGRREGHLFHPSEGKGKGLLFGHGPVFSDFNFRKDPDAVRFLLATDIPITLVPYEAARDVIFTTGALEELAQSSIAGAWLAERATDWMEFWRADVGIEGFYPFDLVAAHYVLSSSDFECAIVSAQVIDGWAPDWLWALDSEGLIVSAITAEPVNVRVVTYCPQVSSTAVL